MQIIDLRDKSDMHIKNARDIAKIFQSIGKSEQIRQERQRTMRILQAMSVGGDVAAAALEPITFGTGLEGFIQRLGAAYAPQVSPIQQAIAARGVQHAFPSPAEQARLEYYKSRRGTAAATAESKESAKRMTRFRNIKTIRDELNNRLETEIEPEIRSVLENQINRLNTKMEDINKQITGTPTTSEVVAGKSFSDTLPLQPGEFTVPQTQGQEITDLEEQILPYVEKLDVESLKELEQIISSGNTVLIKRALQLLRDKYEIL